MSLGGLPSCHIVNNPWHLLLQLCSSLALQKLQQVGCFSYLISERVFVRNLLPWTKYDFMLLQRSKNSQKFSACQCSEQVDSSNLWTFILPHFNRTNTILLWSLNLSCYDLTNLSTSILYLFFRIRVVNRRDKIYIVRNCHWASRIHRKSWTLNKFSFFSVWVATSQ